MRSLHHLDYTHELPHAVPHPAARPLLPPFRDNQDYLEARLAECKLRLLYNGWRLTNAAPSGFSMHVDEQSLLFGTIDSVGPASWQLSAEEGAQLQAQLQWVSHENRSRALASRAAGITLPLERLRDAFSLAPFEEQALLFALSFALQPAFQKLHGIFHPRAHSLDVMGPSVRTALRMLCDSPTQQLDSFRYFGPTSTLRERRLLVCQPPHSWNTHAPLEQHVFFLEPGLFLALVSPTEAGLTKASTAEGAMLSWPKDALDLNAIELPAAVADELREILARFLAERGPASPGAELPGETSEPVPVVWESLFGHGLVCHLDLAPAPNEGNWQAPHTRLTRWAEAIAKATKRPLLQIDLATLAAVAASTPQAPQVWEERLHQLCRDAQLEGAALLLKAGLVWRSAATSTTTQSAQWSALEQALQGFSGLLLLDDAALLDAFQGENRPLLCLSRDEAGKVSLDQPGGALIRKKADRKGLRGLEEHLSQRVVGQEAALQRLAEVLRVRKAHVDANPRRPDGVFLLAGPSGVGKTETAKALNEALFGDESALVRLDMSEFHFRESISGLIGTTPGWVGYERGGRLTNALQKNPESIVLLDEIEKAHPQVLDVFLQVFDDGRLTDGKGQTVDMSRATFLMTSNLGAELFATSQRLGFVKESSRDALAQDLRGALRKHLRPEFINRIDEVLVYYPLTSEHLQQICHRALLALQVRFARKGIWLTIDQAIGPHITAQATPEDGARSLQRHIEQELAQPLAAQMMAHPESTQLSLILRDGTIQVQEDTP